MPIALLPASAQAFAPRSPPTVVLGNRVDSWLTQALKRVNRRRPLNNVQHHQRALVDVLSPESAIWALCSLMLPVAPAAALDTHPDPLVRALRNYELVHVVAYVVHVDFVSQLEVAFKLTQASIDRLVAYHRDIYCKDLAAESYYWPEKDAQIRSLHDEFVQAINRYVFRTGIRALDALEEDGSGELLDGRADEVKRNLMDLFQSLVPPPPPIVDLVRPAAPAPAPAAPRQPSVSLSPEPYSAALAAAAAVAAATAVTPNATTAVMPPNGLPTPPAPLASSLPMVPLGMYPSTASDDGSSVATPPPAQPVDWMAVEWTYLPPSESSSAHVAPEPAIHGVENVNGLWAPMTTEPQHMLPSPAPSYSQLCMSQAENAATLAAAASMATAAAAASAVAPPAVHNMPLVSALPFPSVLAAAQCAGAASAAMVNSQQQAFGPGGSWGFDFNAPFPVA